MKNQQSSNRFRSLPPWKPNNKSHRRDYSLQSSLPDTGKYQTTSDKFEINK